MTKNIQGKNHIVRTILGYGILIFLCFVIFWFSSQGGEDSTNQSNFFVNKIIDKFFPDFNTYEWRVQRDIKDFFAVIVRKGAHFIAYTAMGGLAFIAFFKVKRYGLRYFLSVAFAFLYACSDEFHQLFVEGRTGKITDVLIDTTGGALGAFILLSFTVVILNSGKLSRLRIEESKTKNRNC